MTDLTRPQSSDGGGREIVVVGAGGHARVIVDCLLIAGWNVIGCTDSDATPRSCAGAPVIGTDDLLGKLRGDGIAHAFCALGDNRLRQRVGHQLIGLGFDLPMLIGPGAVVSPLAQLGAGAAILPGAVVNVDSIIGPLAIINTNASVDHDGIIGTAAHIGPGSALAGEVDVGERSFVATGSAVIPKCRIGADSIIGAGSVVICDIPANVVAFGNPARVRRPYP